MIGDMYGFTNIMLDRFPAAAAAAANASECDCDELENREACKLLLLLLNELLLNELDEGFNGLLLAPFMRPFTVERPDWLFIKLDCCCSIEGSSIFL